MLWITCKCLVGGRKEGKMGEGERKGRRKGRDLLNGYSAHCGVHEKSLISLDRTIKNKRKRGSNSDYATCFSSIS
jgi:hypothetical protein